MNTPKTLAIIPARGGSKSVHKKNLRELAGKSLISYTINVAKSCKAIDKVLLSTDCEEIAEHAKSLGLEIPFLRPSDLAKDDTPDLPVFKHALEWLKENEDYSPDFVVHLRPTSPLRTTGDIEDVIAKWVETKSDSVRTVSPAEGVHHPYWMFREENGFAKSFIDGIDINKYYQRQLLPPAYRLNGMVDGFTPKNALDGKSLWGDKISLVVTPIERSFDIDTETDLRIVESVLRENI